MGGKEQANSTQCSSSQLSPCSGSAGGPSLQPPGQQPLKEQHSRHPHMPTETQEHGSAHDRTVGDDGVDATHEAEGRQSSGSHFGSSTGKREGERLRVMDDMLPKHRLVAMFEEQRSRERAAEDRTLASALNHLNLAEAASSAPPSQRPARDCYSTPESQSVPMATSNGADSE